MAFIRPAIGFCVLIVSMGLVYPSCAIALGGARRTSGAKNLGRQSISPGFGDFPSPIVIGPDGFPISQGFGNPQPGDENSQNTEDREDEENRGTATEERRNEREWESNPLLSQIPAEVFSDLYLLEDAVVENGCDTNLCFALQGGDSITNEDYQNQVNFVDIVLNIIASGGRTNIAAVQYHTVPSLISFLTGNRDGFLRRLHSSTRVSGDSNIASGITFCTGTLGARFDDANKIIIIGNSLDKAGPFVSQISENFLRLGGSISAVSVGPTDIDRVESLTGNRNAIINIRGFFGLSEIIVGVVQDVCNMSK